MNKLKLIITSILLITLTILTGCVSIDTYDDVKILLYAADGVGDNYFDVQDQLKLWNVTITTVGLTSTVTGCGNKHKGRKITPALTIDEISDEALSSYHALFIPSGSYWERNMNSPEFKNFLSRAVSHGLIISSMCVGTPMFSSVPELTRGRYLMAHINGAFYLEDKGAHIINEGLVVIDDRIVTGGIGGGFDHGGHRRAPYPQFTGSLLRIIRNRIYLSDSTLTDGEQSGEFQFTAELNNAGSFYKSSPDLEVPIVESLVLNIFKTDSNEILQTIELERKSSKKYLCNFTIAGNEPFYGTLEITNSNSEREIYRNLF